MSEKLFEEIFQKKTMEDIELRSEEVQEILSRPPGILVRWGITVFFSVIMLLFVGGCFFKYPDVVKAEIVITTEHPPAWLVARSTGKLQEIFGMDRCYVKNRELIAVMENPAVTNDVLKLKKTIGDFVLSDSCVCEFSFPENLKLGNIQAAYSNFLKSLISYQDFLLLDLYAQKEQAFRKELDEYNIYISHLIKQVQLNEEEMKIAENSYNREKNLHDRNVISTSDYEEAKRAYLGYKNSTEQLMLTLSSSRIQEAKLEQNIVEIQLERVREANNLLMLLKTAFDELQLAINTWELTYVFVAPVEGMLSYQHVWRENQEIAIGEKVFSIIAENPGEIIGKATLPVTGIGKVKAGQYANIHVTGYPYMEFGYLTGEVLSVSMLASESMYNVTMSLSQELVTSYNRQVSFTGELTGIAEIMTDERSFTARLFAPLKYVWDKHFRH